MFCKRIVCAAVIGADLLFIVNVSRCSVTGCDLCGTDAADHDSVAVKSHFFLLIVYFYFFDFFNNQVICHKIGRMSSRNPVFV